MHIFFVMVFTSRNIGAGTNWYQPNIIQFITNIKEQSIEKKIISI
jgi:hypothetical protein